LDAGGAPGSRNMQSQMLNSVCSVPEPIRDRICMVTGNISPTYAPLFYAFGRYYEGDPMTVQEFVKFNIHDLP
jgi:hypothetical protein